MAERYVAREIGDALRLWPLRTSAKTSIMEFKNARTGVSAYQNQINAETVPCILIW